MMLLEHKKAGGLLTVYYYGKDINRDSCERKGGERERNIELYTLSGTRLSSLLFISPGKR